MLFQTDFSCGNEPYPLPSELPESFWCVCASEPSVGPRWRLAYVFQVSLTLLFSLCFFHILCIQFLGTQKELGKIKVYDRCFWQSPGTSMPSAAHPAVFLILCGAGSNAPGKSRAPEEAVSAPIALQISKTKKGSCWKDWKRKYFSVNRYFFLSGPFKICLLKLVSLN